jgi:PAS domain S-box-containing protein
MLFYGTIPAVAELMLGHLAAPTSEVAAVSRRAPTELERARSLIEGIFAALPCGVAIVNRDYHVIDANPAYFKPLGYDRAEVRSRHCYEVFRRHPNPCSMLGEPCPIAAARAAGAVGRVRCEHRLPDGRVRNLEYAASPLLDEQGSVSEYVLLVNDLTDLREAEERLRLTSTALENMNTRFARHDEELKEEAGRLQQANVELARLSRARSEFVAAVSLELRTPLAAISEGVQLVEDGSFGALNAEQHTFLRLAGNNTKRLTDLLNDLLDLSKLEAGKVQVHRRRLDLCRVARDAAKSYDAIARGNHQTLSVDLPKGLEPALADEESVWRILSNLVGNAVKYTPAGGRITIAADRLPPESSSSSIKLEPPSQPELDAGGLSRASGARIAITVSDTGSGVPTDQQYRLFGRAEPVSPPDLARSRSTGLGIALCRQLAELNGGRLSLESEEGKGSRFSFTLPVYTEFAGLAAAERYFASAVADPRIGTPTVYCFLVQPGNARNGLVPQSEEILDSLFPKPAVRSVVDSGRGVLVFVPRKLTDAELRPISETLKGTSLFTGKYKSKARLEFGTLDYDRLRLKLQSLLAGLPEPVGNSAERWWDAIFEELKPGLAGVS